MENKKYLDFSVNDVDEASQHDDEIKHVPRITKIVLKVG